MPTDAAKPGGAKKRGPRRRPRPKSGSRTTRTGDAAQAVIKAPVAAVAPGGQGYREALYLGQEHGRS